MIKILSIDGGGIRGIIPALVLAEIEKRLKRPTSDLFDLIAGTSTGGIIALGLVKPDKNNVAQYTAKMLADLYEKDGEKIFSSTVWYKISSGAGLFQEKYPTSGIETVLEKYFGQTKLSDAITDVIVPSYEIEERVPWFFKSRKCKDPKYEGRDVYMKEAARATSAAPIYFEPARIKIDDFHAFIDGGVFANNPAMCAYVEAKSIYKKEEDFLVVSLGCGEHTRPVFYDKAKDWGLAMWAKPVFSIVSDGVSSVVDYQLKQILTPIDGKKRYFRFQSKLDIGSDNMDNATAGNIHALKILAQDIINENSELIDSLGELLV